VIVGQETDGTVTPLDLGLDWMVSRRKWFIGTRSLRRPAMLAPDRRQLVGLLPHDPDDLLPEGAPLPAAANGIGTAGVAGHVTSSYRSAALGRTFALALLAGGRARVGSDAVVDVEGRSVPAAVTAPVFYDPENLRRDG
jgi:sarcosine oxidase subunit alpha